ncbi:MAG: nucleoside deaminase [Candidatus Omnitrophica bacterium]|nr:nucleoside deaminase [Candidatus Omnitrophota bacterium]
MSEEHLRFMESALKEAEKGLSEGGIPIGAVLVKDGVIIGRGHNRRIQEGSSILHAEIDCLQKAGRLKAADYQKCVIYTTLSPCDMCAGAILLYKIPVVVVGENENFKGPEEYLQSRGVTLVNLNSDKCKQFMKGFIAKKPGLWSEDIGV